MELPLRDLGGLHGVDFQRMRAVLDWKPKDVRPRQSQSTINGPRSNVLLTHLREWVR
jgi:hypothetical protein